MEDDEEGCGEVGVGEGWSEGRWMALLLGWLNDWVVERSLLRKSLLKKEWGILHESQDSWTPPKGRNE